MPIHNPNGNPGEGHITIVPSNYSVIGQGTYAWTFNPNQVMGAVWRNTTYTNLDNISYQVYLSQGTYTLQLIVLTATSEGIVDVDINGVEVASFDLYANPAVFNVNMTQTGIVIAASGLKTLKTRLHGKNPLSANWIGDITLIALWRTA